jgi:hypothetical protein
MRDFHASTPNRLTHFPNVFALYAAGIANALIQEEKNTVDSSAGCQVKFAHCLPENKKRTSRVYEEPT